MTVMERRAAALCDGSTPTGPRWERRAEARFGTSARVLLSWREQGRDRVASARLIDVSRGGAALAVEGVPPATTPVRVCLEGRADRQWSEAEILGVERGRDDSTRVRLKFRARWSSALLEAAVVGTRSRRTARHDPFAGIEALEGRQLLTTAIDGPISPVAALYATPPPATFFQIADDALLSNVLYQSPSRMASQIAADGAVGVNATWEAGLAKSWYIEGQRYGADFVQAGVVTGNADLVQQGWKILDWGFAHEAADGSFPGSGDAFHSTSMFVEAGARALLLEVQSGAPEAAALVAQYLPEIDASAHWLMSPGVAVKGNANDAPYTHRRWLLAAALGEVAALTNDPATADAAGAYAQAGLALQTADGMNPEKGGGDVSYQAYGILMAERYRAVRGDDGLRAQIDSMIVAGLNWEERWIDSAGRVSIADSTRTGSELSWSGTLKTIDYKTIVQAFAVATTLTGDPSYGGVARAVASGRGWAIN